MVDYSPIRGLPCAPLFPVNGSEISVLIRPRVPDADIVLLEVANVGCARDKPEQFVDDTWPVNPLCGDRWKASSEVVSHLMSEDREGPSSSPIATLNTLAEDGLDEVQILVHADAGHSGGIDALRTSPNNSEKSWTHR
uniref:Uncharacterized protein n=1 Tax=uncultured marine group II/III euryarchaeote KM3_27_D02 TaxID=1456428 RepID=A0A075GWH9_9EURY|nr:hypothetical protein [uncultured marine group II/III euryarchaeote KM3_27_D02]